MKHPISKLVRAVHRRGLIGSAHHVALASWRRLFRHRQFVYELPRNAAAALKVPIPAEARLRQVGGTDPLPVEFAEALASAHGNAFVEHAKSEMSKGASLFTLESQGRIVSLLWMKPGQRIPAWYIPLTPNDVVLYGWWTDPDCRGKGLIGVLIGAAVRATDDNAGRILADVRVWNVASIRAMERVGFRRIAEAKPL